MILVKVFSVMICSKPKTFSVPVSFIVLNLFFLGVFFCFAAAFSYLANETASYPAKGEIILQGSLIESLHMYKAGIAPGFVEDAWKQISEKEKNITQQIFNCDPPDPVTLQQMQLITEKADDRRGRRPDRRGRSRS